MKFNTLLALLIFPLILAPIAHASIDPVVDAIDKRLPDSDAIAKAAVTPKPKRRALAARGYGQIMSPKGIDTLLKLTGDSIPWVREEAAFAIGQLGWLPESAGGKEAQLQTKLSELTHDKQLSVREAAVEALGKVGGTQASDLLSPFFSDREASVRALAVMGLFRARMILKLRDPEHPPGALPDSLREHLLQLAEDKDPNVRQSVAYFFARNSEPKAEVTMGKLSHESNKFTRMLAVMALGKMKAKASKIELETALSDSEYFVRVAAVTALDASGESLLPFGERLFRDKTFHVRAAVATALKGGKPEELSLLQRALEHDPSATVKAEALKNLAKAKSGSELAAFLTEQAKSPLWQSREAAVQSAEPLEVEAKENFLSTLVRGETDHLVRAAALEAWFALPTAPAFEQLKKSLESPELSERATAISALKDRKESGLVDLAWATYEKSLDQKWVEAREDLVEIFIKNQSDATTGFLKQILRDPDRSVRAKAKTALQSRGATDLPEVPEASLSFSPFRENTFRKNPRVEIQTNRGSFTLECFPLEAPIHVADFIGHVKAGFYNGLSWHRVISNFVVQGGDPDGTGFGGAGYSLRAEINRHPFARGALGMPRSQGFDTGGGQLFFSHIPTPHLDGQYTVFGQVRSGVEVLDKLERGDKILKAKLLP